jgi:hypothetical protein
VEGSYELFRPYVREDFPATCAYCLLQAFFAAGVDKFDMHFEATPDGRWIGRTLSAKYTIDALRLNRPHLVELRQLLHRA